MFPDEAHVLRCSLDFEQLLAPSDRPLRATQMLLSCHRLPDVGSVAALVAPGPHRWERRPVAALVAAGPHRW